LKQLYRVVDDATFNDSVDFPDIANVGERIGIQDH
jgi:hypothetical protein